MKKHQSESTPFQFFNLFYTRNNFFLSKDFFIVEKKPNLT